MSANAVRMSRAGNAFNPQSTLAFIVSNAEKEFSRLEYQRF